MEADGAGGMVAVVQGLRDAGLAVTVVNNRHLRNSLIPISKSSVETSTQSMLMGRSQAAQVRDDHYTSSYQVAHCSARPSSPPQRLPEFPPQRPDYIRNQGNFQVGGYGRGEYDSLSPMASHYRGGMAWQARGPVYSSRLSPPAENSDAFVNSLRQYPVPFAPERSVSSELIQRLINYTQYKHLPKNASRSTRSLREETPAKDIKTDTTSTKNIQTYTRTRTESRDHGANTSNELKISLGKKGRSFASMSPYNVRTKIDHNETYDYLKQSSSRRYFVRHPDVRYIKDVKKCIRDTITQMYDTPQLCPQIKRRYSHHKREYHGSKSAFPPCPKHPDVSCLCKKPPCSFVADRQKPEPSTALESGIEKDIRNWLKGIPVYADDSTDNKRKREEMIKDLADKLKSLERDKNFENHAKKEIVKCIEKLPIWYPGGKNEQEMYRNKIADDLFNTLAASEKWNVLHGVIQQLAVLAELRLRAPRDYVGARRRPAMLAAPHCRTNLLKFDPL